MSAFKWTEETYAASVSSRCWWCTPYDNGWPGSPDHGYDLSKDEELRDIVAMEHDLAPVPVWASQLVQGAMRFVPPCGHHSFPGPFLDIVDAIGMQMPPVFVRACFTADPDRKKAMMDYCLCLDAWLAGASADAAAQELNALAHRRIDWTTVCAQLWSALGERTETKELLVERTLLQLRYWIKVTVWRDDPASQFGRDQYLGDYSPDGCLAVENGNPLCGAPSFDLQSSPRIQRIEARLAEICPDWEWFRQRIAAVDCMNLCAPKTFRYLERLLWAIGKERPVSLPWQPVDDEPVPGFLCVDDTYPAHDDAAVWWDAFLSALRNWWQDAPPTGDLGEDLAQRLGDSTAVKRWLVRLFARRLHLLAETGPIRRLVKIGKP